MTDAQAKNEFQKQFQRALWACVKRRFSIEECFGVVWEETLQKVKLPETSCREVYQELISWAKTVTKLKLPPRTIRHQCYKQYPTLMQHHDPYQTEAGPELDLFIHHQVLRKSPSERPPCYSTDSEEADKLKKLIEAHYGAPFVCGRTALRGKPWFARYEIDPGNPTEVLAETYALAICRLALLRAERR